MELHDRPKWHALLSAQKIYLFSGKPLDWQAINEAESANSIASWYFAFLRCILVSQRYR